MKQKQNSVPFLQFKSICKSFGETKAVSNADLTIRCGEIYAIVGENGAGKSTIVSMLAGQLSPDSGTISIKGDPVTLDSPEASLSKGVGVVYQEPKLVETMTVAENIILAKKVPFFTRKKAILENIKELAELYQIRINLDQNISELSVGEKQQLEILKLLYQESELMVFDEATALLSDSETSSLFNLLRNLVSSNKTVLFISHNLHEVKTLADKIAVLRNGSVQKVVNSDEITTEELVAEIIGEIKELDIIRKPIRHRQVLLDVKSICGDKIKDITFSVKQGEVLGFISLTGNGQKELIEILTNKKQALSGDCFLFGKVISQFFDDQNATNLLSYIPEDRYGLATGKHLDLLETFLLTTQQDFVNGVWLEKDKAKLKAEKLIEEFKIRATDTEMLAEELSGGNLQKLILAREFFNKPKLMIIEQPTQGLDVASKNEIWQLLLDAREQAGLLIFTTDISEVMALSDRIGVISDGRIVDIFDARDKEKLATIPKLISRQC